MNCPHCQKEIASEDAVPKSYIRKMLNDLIDTATSDEDKLRGLDLLSKLEGYTGSNLKRDQKKLGVFIVQSSTLKKRLEGPGKEQGDATS